MAVNRPNLMAAVISKPRRMAMAAQNTVMNAGLTGVTHSNPNILLPDYSLGGSLLTEDTSTSVHSSGRQLGDMFNMLTNGIWNISTHAKPNGRTWVRLMFSDVAVGTAMVDFDIANMVVGTKSAAGSSGGLMQPFNEKIEWADNGWVRISFAAHTMRHDATRQTNYAVRMMTADNTISYTGDGTSGMYFWGTTLIRGVHPPTYGNNQFIRNITNNPLWFAV